MELPEKFTTRLREELGEEEARALCAALDGEPPVSVRLNPAKAGAGAFGPETTDPTAVPAAANPDPAATTPADVPAPAATAPEGPDPAAAAPASSDATATDPTETVPAEPDPTETVPANPVPAETAGTTFPCRLHRLAAAGPARQVPWCPAGRYLASRPQFTFDPAFHAGAYYVQEASSQFVAHLAGDIAGLRILDLCAAPGGKTTLYASLAGPEGLVVANEIDRRRAQVLADNVRKWGTGNVAVTCCDPHTICAAESWFDVVAVDAPCSGEGMFRKDDAARGEWSEAAVRLCAARQDEILREAWRALKPGGLLLYSTCTFNRTEDEGSLERMLAWAGDEVAEAAPEPADPAWNIVQGSTGPFRTFRFYPHRACGEGFFAAVARKAEDAPGRPALPKARRQVIAQADRAAVAELRRWVRNPEAMTFGVIGDACYGWYAAQAQAVKALSAVVPVIASGVEMGQIFKGRLKPDPALAFFAELDRGAVPAAEVDEETALRYLRRQDIPAERLAEGLNLICCADHALGFAKRIGNRVNNMYPNSLRIIKQ